MTLIPVGDRKQQHRLIRAVDARAALQCRSHRSALKLPHETVLDLWVDLSRPNDDRCLETNWCLKETVCPAPGA
ncbi:MAG TPA: hypothetical protein PKZ32_12280 [Candidatus Melainabacteria bacterium]|nr:hypothetical protein [Candidatus Melainabacteria bacterium]